MDEDILEQKSEKSGSLGVIVAVIAVLLAIFAGYLAYSTRSDLKRIQSDFANDNNKRAEIREEFNAVNTNLEALSQRVDGLATKVRMLGNNNGEQLRQQTQEGFDQVATAIKGNQDNIKKLEKELLELVGNLQSGGIRRVAGSTSTTSSASYQTSDSSDSSAVASSDGLDAERMYEIKKGDFFIHIAKRYNLSLNELQNANPSVDPNRLRIGQKIYIPAP